MGLGSFGSLGPLDPPGGGTQLQVILFRSHFGSRYQVARAEMANLPRYSWEAERPYWDDGDETAANSHLHASQMLIEFLVHLLLEGKLSAKSLCTIAYFATAAGAQGVVRQYAKDPGGQSGSFQRHIDSVMGVDLGRMRKSMYHISTPGLDKHDAGRSTHDMPVN